MTFLLGILQLPTTDPSFASYLLPAPLWCRPESVSTFGLPAFFPSSSSFFFFLSSISLITIFKTPKWKLRGQGRGPWARCKRRPVLGPGLAQGTLVFALLPILRRGEGQRWSCGSHWPAWSRTLTSFGVCSVPHAPGLVQPAREGPSGFVTVTQQLLDPDSPGIITLHIQEFIHINLQFWDLFLEVVEASKLPLNSLLQVEVLPLLLVALFDSDLPLVPHWALLVRSLGPSPAPQVCPEGRHWALGHQCLAQEAGCQHCPCQLLPTPTPLPPPHLPLSCHVDKAKAMLHIRLPLAPPLL